jgi:acylpyruvate hydrolase
VIGKQGRDIPSSKAQDFISGYVLAVDLTGRNIQDEAKAKGHPWTVAKGFDTFTPISKFIPKALVEQQKGFNGLFKLSLMLDEQIKQNGSTKDMIYSVPHLIEYVSSVMTLEENDIILTGIWLCFFNIINSLKGLKINLAFKRDAIGSGAY